MTDSKTPLFRIDAFLSYLERKRFPVDDDRRTQLTSLLYMLGPECPLNQLKYAICAIFTTNVAEQRDFYTAFDTYFEGLEPETLMCVTPPPKHAPTWFEQIRKNKWLSIAAGLLGLLILFSDFPFEQKNTPPKNQEIPIKAKPKAVSVQDFPTWTEPETGMEFVKIPAGCFIMGSPKNEAGRGNDEGPQHKVCLDGFWMGKYEVTNKQYRTWKKNHDSQVYRRHSLNGDSQPAVYVTWDEATAFAKWLTEQHKGRYTFRLPTEAEWEYAVRAGTRTSFYFGDDADIRGEYAWYAGNSERQTHPVGQLKPNAWGLYDMAGNVGEWCQDWYRDKYYSASPERNPDGSSSGSSRVIRGGSWVNDAKYFPKYFRSAYRNARVPDRCYDYVGFRLVVEFSSELEPVTRKEQEVTTKTKPEAEPIQDLSTWTEPQTGMEFVKIPAGCFIMGSPEDEAWRDNDEGPQHKVCLDGFLMGKYEVTNKQYRTWKKNHDSQVYRRHSLNGDSQPAVYVTWDDATAFAEWLTEQHGGRYTFRLPTEAEWEYAARAGTLTKFYFGDNADMLKEYAWYRKNSDSQTHQIGQLKPNAWGLCDMAGNVWEWCQDWYSKAYYSESPERNPDGPSSGSYRVMRGGSWSSLAGCYRSAGRSTCAPGYRYGRIGFRLVRTP